MWLRTILLATTLCLSINSAFGQAGGTAGEGVRKPDAVPLPAAKPRLLKEMIPSEVAAAQAADPRLIVPVGTCEQHGPHLPMSCDTIIVDRLADLHRELVLDDRAHVGGGGSEQGRGVGDFDHLAYGSGLQGKIHASRLIELQMEGSVG